MGLVSGGRMATELANISLGIDMSHLGQNQNLQDKASLEQTQSTTSGETTPLNPATAPKLSILDQVLQDSGYEKSAENPFVFRKDFFA